MACDRKIRELEHGIRQLEEPDHEWPDRKEKPSLRAGKIADIEVLGDPERLRRLDLTFLK